MFPAYRFSKHARKRFYGARITTARQVASASTRGRRLLCGGGGGGAGGVAVAAADVVLNVVDAADVPEQPAAFYVGAADRVHRVE